MTHIAGSPLAAELIDAIHRDDLVTLVDDRLGDGTVDELLSAADHTTRAIADVARHHATIVRQALSERAVDGTVDQPPARQQRPVVSVSIEPDALARTRAVLEGAGYASLHDLSPGAWESYRRVMGHARFTSLTDDAAQIDVGWGDDPAPPRTPAHALARPGINQWTGTALPIWAWWAYPAVRARDLVRDRVVRRTPAPVIGPHLPTPGDLVAPVLRWAGIDERDVLLDAGCGDGRVLVHAARSVGCRGIGIELDPALARRAGERAEAAGVDHLVTVIEGDLDRVPVDEATAVFLFLPSGMVADAVARLDRSLPSGATIVAHEQSPLVDVPTAEARAPIFAPASLTVAHRWTAGGQR